MIDTTILVMKQEDFKVVRHDLFVPDASGLWSVPYLPKNQSWGVKCVQNADMEAKRLDLYLPRLTLCKRGIEVTLYIEFSAPKLLYKNNFLELQNSDFETILELLLARLRRMGVIVSHDALKNAKVRSCHYSKNILYTDYTTVSEVLSVLAKIPLHRFMDINADRYEDQGRALRYHCKSYSLVLYDKIADLKKPACRAVEKSDRDFNLQYNIFDEIRRQEKLPVEVLRFEFRLCDSRAIKKWFKKVGIKKNLVFEEMFDSNVSRQVLTYFWNEIDRKLRLVLLEDVTLLHFASMIAKKRPQWSLQKTMAVVALSEVMKVDGGRTMSNILSARFHQTTVKRLLAQLDGLDIDIDEEKYKPFHILSDVLDSMEPLKESDYHLN